MLEQMREPSDEVLQIMKQLGSKTESERVAAEESIKKFGKEHIEEFLAALAQEQRKHKRSSQIFSCILLGLFSVTVISGLITHNWDSIMTTSGMLGLFGMSVGVTSAQKRITKELAQFQDIRTVGAFAEALEFGDPEIKRMAELKLIELLPRLQAADNSLLSGDQRQALYRAIVGSNADLTLTILKALEQVGDTTAVPHVKRIVGQHISKSANLKIRDAAQECLQKLEERAELELASHQLLRASSASAVPADTLLRPVIINTQTSSDELLRPSQADTH